MPESGDTTGGELYECRICGDAFDDKNGRGVHMGLSHTNEEYQGELLAELNRVADKLGRTPTRSEVSEHGEYSTSAYERRFGSWNEALRTAGHDPNKSMSIPDEELLAEIERLADERGRAPTRDEMNEYGEYSGGVCATRFGSWNDAVRTAGFDPAKYMSISDEELLAEIDRVVDKLGRVPTGREMDEYGEYSQGPYRERFGSWSSALREAGYEPNRYYNITKEELLSEIERLADELGRVPTVEDLNKHGICSIEVYLRHFDSWNDALHKVGYEPNVHRDVPDEELLSEIKRLADELGRVPIQMDMDVDGEYSSSLYGQRFPTWNTAIREAGYEPNYIIGERKEGTVYRGPNWPEQRLVAVRRDDFACRACGTPVEDLDRDIPVHHITPAREFDAHQPDVETDYETMNDPSNLISLCPSCHGRFGERWQDCTPDEFAERAQTALETEVTPDAQPATA